MFYINKSSICCFLDGEYFYPIRERSGLISQLSLFEIIERVENANLNNVQRKSYELLYPDVQPERNNPF